MTVVKRLAPLIGLMAAAAVGVVLVISGGDEGPAMERVTTIDGVVADIPAGWVASADTQFRFEPPGSDLSNVDSWTIAWACGPDGCAERSLDEWRAIESRLETFTRAREDEGDLLFDLVETDEGDAHVLRARTAGNQTVVAVAMFYDGADHYLECNLALAGDPGGLEEAIVKACRSAVPPR